MGHGQTCKIKGTSDNCLQTELGYTLMLKKVWHVLQDCLNVISTGQLENEGYNNEFNNWRWNHSKGSLIMVCREKTYTLYKMRAKFCLGRSLLMKGIDSYSYNHYLAGK